MKGPFTEKAKQAIQNAQNAAGELGHSHVGTEHLLLGLARVSDSVAARVMEMQNANANNILNELNNVVGAGGMATAGGNTPQDYTPRTKRIIEQSHAEAMRMKTN
jgi:ATP-dependent Clp protease ATP-binding subunit ClpC